jgi:hypothetical protein
MKTAVEWLESEMLEHYSPFDNKLLYEAIHKAKEMEKEQLQTHKYSEFDLISAFEYGWNQRHFDKTDEDELQQIQKRFIQSINETKQQEQ